MGLKILRARAIRARFTLAVTALGFIACGVTTKSAAPSAAGSGSGGTTDGPHGAGATSQAGSGPETGGALSGGGGGGVALASGSGAVESAGASLTAAGAGGDADAAQAGAPTAGSASPACQLANANPELALPFFDGTSVLLPTAYDGVTPTPMLFGFHESGSMREIPTQIPATHPLRQNYVLVVPTSMATVGGFETGADYAMVDELYQAVSQTICFDTRNVFAVGHSSGARFMTHAISKSNFRAAAMIGALAAYTPNPAKPSLIIHGANDYYANSFQDPDGSVALSAYIRRNGCGPTSMAASVPSCPNVTPGCVDYLDCAQPLRFCRHDDPGPEGWNDGWPCFATDLIYEFFESQRAP